MNDDSSNFRELSNLLHALEEMNRMELLNGKEVFRFTDNAVSEDAFKNGIRAMGDDLVTVL